MCAASDAFQQNKADRCRSLRVVPRNKVRYLLACVMIQREAQRRLAIVLDCQRQTLILLTDEGHVQVHTMFQAKALRAWLLEAPKNFLA